MKRKDASMSSVKVFRRGSLLKNLPLYGALTNTRAWQTLRHRLSLSSDTRNNSTFTGFLRLPAQYDALSGPVLEYLGGINRTEPLGIAVIGCSNGAEAYTIASALKKAFSSLDFSIKAFDIDPEMLKKAKSSCYSSSEVFNNKVITEAFIKDTFDVKDGLFSVKVEIKKHVSFAQANALDRTLLESAGTNDIVFAQNFLFHLDRKDARIALGNIMRLMKPKAAIFVDGVDIDIRSKMTRQYGLQPLDFKVEEIHNEARMARAAGWPYSYWGLEPYRMRRKDSLRRYATVFLK